MEPLNSRIIAPAPAMARANSAQRGGRPRSGRLKLRDGKARSGNMASRAGSNTSAMTSSKSTPVPATRPKRFMGSCGMTIQGSSRLACKTLVKDIPGDVIEVAPMKGFPVVKDLVVDMEHFFHKYRAIKPDFINTTPAPVKERPQSPAEQQHIDDPARCILCGCCTASCPSFWKNDGYLGPAALLKAWRFVADTRDEAAQDRLDLVNGENGLWRCHLIFNCLEACPKEIDIPAALSKLKRAVVFGGTR